jgi:sec-independent protein translocase protein TatA
VETPIGGITVFSSLGPLEIVLIVVVLLLVFGPKRLPSLGRSLGTGLREFKDSITGEDKRREQDADDDGAGERPALSEAPAAEPAAPAPAAAAPANGAPAAAAPASQADPAPERRA